MIIVSCSKEAEPVFINGVWDAIYYERVICDDSLKDITIDFREDSTYLIDGDEVVFERYTLDIDSLGSYNFELVKNVNGEQVIENESGQYLSTGFNDILFCLDSCTDTIFIEGIYVRTFNELDLNWTDTLDTGCGFVFQANLR